MDLLTQSLLGSAMAQSAAAPDKIRKAAIIGLLAGLSADLVMLMVFGSAGISAAVFLLLIKKEITANN